MSQKIKKFITNNITDSITFEQLEFFRILRFYYFIINYNGVNLTFLKWYHFNKVITNFSLTILFFNHNLLTLQFFLFKKAKKRRWNSTKKKLHNITFLSKLSKSLIHKKVSRKVINFLNVKYVGYFLKKTNNKSNPIVNKIPLTQRVINNSYLEFFYKFKKEKVHVKEHLNQFVNVKYFESEDDKFSIYLRNYHQKPFWKLRLARIIHWNIFFKKKSIKKQRYKSFLPLFLKRYERYSNVYTYLLSLFILPEVSWTLVQQLLIFFKQLLVLKLNPSIYLLPIGFFKLIHWRNQTIKPLKAKKIIGRWSYLNYKRSQYPWLQKKKNFPKSIKHLKPNSSSLKKPLQYDPATGAVVFFRPIDNFSLNFSEMFKANLLVKLHGYRYNV
jgi:hypothetical protein